MTDAQPTPRTDQNCWREGVGPNSECTTSEFARQLERELTVATTALADARRALEEARAETVECLTAFMEGWDSDWQPSGTPYEILKRFAQFYHAQASNITHYQQREDALRKAVLKLEDEHRTLTAEPARLRAGLAAEWQDIATAPKDGTEVFLYFATGVLHSCNRSFNGAVGAWTGKAWYLGCIWASTSSHAQPSHWRSLPTAP